MRTLHSTNEPFVNKRTSARCRLGEHSAFKDQKFNISAARLLPCVKHECGELERVDNLSSGQVRGNQVPFFFFQSTTALQEGNVTAAVFAAKKAIRSSG